MEKNNFNPIGNRPLAPTIYDENITPLESMNKLAYKINQLIGDDTNVKEVVDKLLDVYSSHMKLQGGYCEELKCIAFENPISCDLIKPESPIYTPVKNIEVGVSNVKGNVTFYQWQYKNDKGLFVDLEAQGSNSAKCYVPVTFYNSGDTLEFRCKLQNDKYTYYTDAIVIEYVEPSINIAQTYQNIGVNLYSNNKLSWSRVSGSFAITNKKWEFNSGTGWIDSPVQGDTINPYYYIDRGTKTNGVSVGSGDIGTDKTVQWRFTCTLRDTGKTIISNVLNTTIHMIDFDCGSATFNGVANNNWDNASNMVQWFSYMKNYNSSKRYCDLALSINKNLNNSVITSVQWLQSATSIRFYYKPNPNDLLENATDINETITVEQVKSGYLWNNVYAFRLQVVVGNIAYYSESVYVNTNLAEIDIAASPTGTINIGSILTLTSTFNSLVPSIYDVNNIQWFLSNNKNSWTSYSIYGDTNNIIKVKIYNDNASHVDGFGVNGGTELYVWAIVDDKIAGAKTITIKQS